MIDPFVFLAPLLLLPVVGLLRFIGCDLYAGGIINPVTTPTIMITNAPGSLGPGQSYPFAAQDSGNNDVTNLANWSTDNGTFDSTKHGYYTAPNAPGKSVTIFATYLPLGATSRASDQKTVAIVPVSVTITPEAGVDLTQVTPGQTFKFTVQVTGVVDPSPTVTVGIGILTGGGGKYTAPSPFKTSNQTDTITATSSVSPLAAPATLHITLISGNRAIWVGFDTTTMGGWKVSYGTQGYAFANVDSGGVTANIVSPPSYFPDPGLTNALVSLGTPFPYTAADSSDPVPPTLITPIAVDWFDATSLQVVFSFNDFALHQVALYCRDHETGREQILDLYEDSTSTLLDTQPLLSFTAGTYAVWKISGAVKVTIMHTPTKGLNCVLSAIFFD